MTGDIGKTAGVGEIAATGSVDEIGDTAAKAFAATAELAKQLITLATSVLALTVTFYKDVTAAGAHLGLVQAAWVLYLVSVAAGVSTLMALAGNLDRPPETNGSPVWSIYRPAIRYSAMLQIGLFVLALGFTVWFGVQVSGGISPAASPPASSP